MLEYKCFRCSHELILLGNHMLSDIEGDDDMSTFDDAIVTIAQCPYCGASYEIMDTPESERENYDYFKFNRKTDYL